jgi:hypothetical protein
MIFSGISGLTISHNPAPTTAVADVDISTVFQPYWVAIQAAATGAATPPILPQKFIQPLTVPVNFPPKSIVDAHETANTGPLANCFLAPQKESRKN